MAVQKEREREQMPELALESFYRGKGGGKKKYRVTSWQERKRGTEVGEREEEEERESGRCSSF